MKNISRWLFTFVMVFLSSGVAIIARAGISPAEQTALRTQYVGKVRIFRKSYRLIDNLEVSPEGTVVGNHRPGYWTVDGAVQVKRVDFRKDRITFKCAKLWANIKGDGQLHYFPAAVVLKGRADYPENTEITFHTQGDGDSVAQFVQRVNQVFLEEQESKLGATPGPIAAYIQSLPVPSDIDPLSAAGFAGTPPKPVSTPNPDRTREAELVGQTGQESFVVLVDEQGKAAVVGFTRLLQFGLEEATIDAVKAWKFEPATRDGKPIAVRMVMNIEYKRPVQY